MCADDSSTCRERLKYKVLGSRRRGRVVDGPFNHRDGSGYVKANYGDYGDAIRNRKAKVLLLGHENSGGMSAFAAKQLYRLGREAKELGNDSTDYQRSHTARSFVPFYAQRMCTAIVMHGAKGILKGLKIARAARLRDGDTSDTMYRGVSLYRCIAMYRDVSDVSDVSR